MESSLDAIEPDYCWRHLRLCGPDEDDDGGGQRPTSLSLSLSRSSSCSRPSLVCRDGLIPDSAHGCTPDFGAIQARYCIADGLVR